VTWLLPKPHVLAALALAAAAGAAADAIGAPLPWLLGPLVVTAVAAMADLRIAGASLRLPKELRAFCIPVIGVAIGATVTPEVVSQARDWWPSLLAVLPFVVIVQFLNYAILRKLSDYDRPTAFFAASPGGLVDAVLCGESRGGVLATMSTQHFARIAVTVATVPFLLSSLADGGSASSAQTTISAWPSVSDIVLLALCAVLGGILGHWLRLPAGMMLGPFILSAALHMTGVSAAGVPPLLVHVAQFVVGGVLGFQFAGVRRAQVARGVGFAALTVAVALCVAEGFALVLSPIVGAPLAAVFLGFAPGGLAEMGLVAVSVGAEPAFVVAHHILRIILTISVAPLLFDRLIAPRGGVNNPEKTGD
jgi:uncharacterized protein